MQALKDVLDSFHLPSLAVMEGGKQVQSSEDWRKRREEILDLLQREMYGITPPPCKVRGKILREDTEAWGGKALERGIELELSAAGGTASFPLTLIIPRSRPVRGLFVNIAFMIRGTDGIRYCPSCPIEEIIDNGFAITLYDYLDVTSDDGDFSSGIAGIFSRNGETGWGKIGMWAYSMSRVADYLLSLEECRGLPLAAAGFSRLGKTALWCGAQDERFDFVIPFGSGTGGTGFTRRNRKESIGELFSRNWFWFCNNFRRYAEDADLLPFDQHFTIAACAPRKFLTAIREEDPWADVENEYLSCIAASEGYRLAGSSGFIAPDTFPRAPASFLEGTIALGLDHGVHFLGRSEWRLAMEYAGGRAAYCT